MQVKKIGKHAFPQINDNLSDVLSKVLHFTNERHRLLINNLNNVNNPGYTPKDLDAHEFASLMEAALAEHITNGRLAYLDAQNTTFGQDSTLNLTPAVDKKAKNLFQNDSKAYIKLQTEKLAENATNNRIAVELIRKKNNMVQSVHR